MQNDKSERKRHLPKGTTFRRIRFLFYFLVLLLLFFQFGYTPLRYSMMTEEAIFGEMSTRLEEDPDYKRQVRLTTQILNRHRRRENQQSREMATWAMQKRAFAARALIVGPVRAAEMCARD